MHIRKVLHLFGLVIASLTLVTVVISASGNLLSASFAQEQNLTSNMTDNEDAVGVHSPDLGSEENIASTNRDVQRS